jgi:capsule polysaccharide export protein KpsC/LpsZ
LAAVRKNNENAWIIFKPHPNELTTGQYGKRKAIECLKYCNQIALEGDINEWFKKVDEVHVISSTAGLEALIQEKKVYTYGTPCYAGWGLTIDYTKQSNRRRNLNLKELIAITYGLYPRYFDWTKDSFGSAVESIEQLIGVKEGRIIQFKNEKASKLQKRVRMWRGGRILLLKPLKNWRISRLKKQIDQTTHKNIRQ